MLPTRRRWIAQPDPRARTEAVAPEGRRQAARQTPASSSASARPATCVPTFGLCKDVRVAVGGRKQRLGRYCHIQVHLIHRRLLDEHAVAARLADALERLGSKHAVDAHVGFSMRCRYLDEHHLWTLCAASLPRKKRVTPRFRAFLDRTPEAILRCWQHHFAIAKRDARRCRLGGQRRHAAYRVLLFVTSILVWIVLPANWYAGRWRARLTPARSAVEAIHVDERDHARERRWRCGH